ncbi:MAG: alpha/beta fold hydrolase [Paracoccaceae bacterium]
MDKINLKFHINDQNKKIAYKKFEGKSANSPGVIFLGGLASDMEGTKANYLEKWCQLQNNSFIKFDYSGHGKSDGIFTDGSILSWAEDALSVLDNLTNGKQILIGSSMGAWIAILLAKNRPNKIHAMIGIAAAPDFTEDLMWNNFNDDEKQKILEDGILLQESQYSEEPYKISKNLIFNSKNCLVLREKLILGFPVRILQGTADNDVPIDTALRLINHIDCNDAKLEIVKGADHSFSSDKCLKLIANNLKELLELE